MIDTVILEYKQTLGKLLTLEHAPNSKWNIEYQERIQTRQEMKDLQEYMVSKGFKIIGNNVIDPNGQEHKFNV